MRKTKEIVLEFVRTLTSLCTGLLAALVFATSVFAQSGDSSEQYTFLSTSSAALLPNNNGKLMIVGDPVTLHWGTREISGLKITEFNDKSPLVLASVKMGDVLFSVNGVIFESTEAWSRYILSLRIPHEGFRIEYWSATERGNRAETVPSAIISQDHLEKLRRSSELLGNLYSCSHVEEQDYARLQSLHELINEQPNEVSVKRKKALIAYWTMSLEVAGNAKSHAEAHPCVRRGVDPVVRQRAKERALFMQKCAALSVFEQTLAGKLEGEAMRRWANENRDKAVEVLSAAVKDLNAAGIDGLGWIREVEAKHLTVFDLMPDLSDRERTKQLCIQQNMLLDIRTRIRESR